MDTETETPLLAELRELRLRVPYVTGVLVASVDGMLVAQDTPGIEPEVFAAMSAAQLGLGQQIVAALHSGEFRETVTAATNGYVATFAAGQTALLTVVAGPELNVARLHHEARPVAARIGQLMSAVYHPA
ncbi:roadblock/LC7 domain-containing protein [Catellatospora tritici]|uniref:roadblock/LC7 domain-containing protein n=1 Tax=Catellatospora tritici TaxID=2851566 RepID=UPI0027DFF81D|nr:roadblock/LC7 domain-containing protein [Catellatospora tritici]